MLKCVVYSDPVHSDYVPVTPYFILLPFHLLSPLPSLYLLLLSLLLPLFSLPLSSLSPSTPPPSLYPSHTRLVQQHSSLSVTMLTVPGGSYLLLDMVLAHNVKYLATFYFSRCGEQVPLISNNYAHISVFRM